MKSERNIIIWVVLVAVVVRLIALDRIYLIARDGIHFVSLARLFMSGSLIEGLSHPYHPLYPLLMAFVGGTIGNVELAGQLINLLFSSLTVIPLYLIGRFVSGTKGGIITGLFFAFQPYCVRFSVDVLSDPIFLFFFMLALWFGLKGGAALKSGGWWSLGAGASAGLAYLTRPEGILIVVFLLAWYVWSWFSVSKRLIPEFFLATGALLLAFSMLAAPYLVFIKSHTGTWQFSMKPSVSKALADLQPGEAKEGPSSFSFSPAQGASKEPPVLAPAKPRDSLQRPTFWETLTYPPLRFIETYHYLLFLFLLIGIWGRGDEDRGHGAGVLTWFLLAYVLCLCYLYHALAYVSRRHFLPPLALSLPLAAIGFWQVQKYVEARTASFDNTFCRLLAKHSTIILVLITIVSVAPKALKLQGADKLPLKEAAIWIQENAPHASPVVMSNEPLVAYYAGGEHTDIPPCSYEGLVAFIRKNQVDYVVWGEKEIEQGEPFIRQLQPDNFRKVPLRNGERVLVYEVRR